MDDLEKSLMVIVAAVIIVLGVAAHILTPEGTPAISGLQNVFYALLAGAVIGLLGYMQKTSMPDWETVKFAVTLIISAVAGYVAYTQGITYTNAVTWLYTMGLDVLVERILKTLIRRTTA